MSRPWPCAAASPLVRGRGGPWCRGGRGRGRGRKRGSGRGHRAQGWTACPRVRARDGWLGAGLASLPAIPWPSSVPCEACPGGAARACCPAHESKARSPAMREIGRESARSSSAGQPRLHTRGLALSSARGLSSAAGTPLRERECVRAIRSKSKPTPRPCVILPASDRAQPGRCKPRGSMGLRHGDVDWARDVPHCEGEREGEGASAGAVTSPEMKAMLRRQPIHRAP
jgi:hypothetical protein